MLTKAWNRERICPPRLNETVVMFAHSRSQKSLRFPAAQKRISTKCQYTFSQQSAGQA